MREISQKTRVSTLLATPLLKILIGCFEQGGKTGVLNAPIVLMCSHQNDHLAQTPIKGHTNTRFLPPFRTHIFGVTKHPNSGVTNTLNHFFRFLFCSFWTPKKGAFGTTEKEFFRCWDSKVLLEHFSPHNLFFLFDHCSYHNSPVAP